ncbi:MAG: hypothetical protein ACK57B_15595 [Betaproteobacteria bacterium]|jgi:hypothetical protein
MHKMVWTATALAAVVAMGSAPEAARAQAQPAATASSPAKKELVSKLLTLQAPGIEQLATQIVQQPAVVLMQQAGAALQRLPQDKREALARDIDADLRKYADESLPVVRKRATELAPLTVGVVLDERFSEDELRQIVATLENPAWRKFQGAANDMQRALVERLVADTKGQVDPKLQALQKSMGDRLRAAAPASAPAPAASPAPAPAAAPARTPAARP